jgi:aspartate/methionine/tyrosine aminotransferase
VTSGLVKVYRARRDALVSGLTSAGWAVVPPKATFYAWIPTPRALPSTQVAARLLEEADIVVTPGIGFGPSGEHYVRAALTVGEERIREATSRIARLNF